eukprot:CAMPEP_0119285672 /NCGR_PEP_ID=MMETSP1329-20130426/32621_1 /TAXON_ID=114041 /ORGANISM="Genus nov. species nov., Strain RCC1024" /LENGTH=193 /DNA_ID=CAMNT_0007286387 /DNA_START=221 /DNA_END=799 /DNA_ORIENTATION=+
MPRKRKRVAAVDYVPGCSIVKLQQDGDCFYRAVAIAYESSGLCAAAEAREDEFEPDEAQVLRLRRCVSRRVDDGVFDTFAMLHAAGLDDFAFMRRLPDAAALRAKLCVSGAASGATRCVWANDFEITALCEALGMTALIVDAGAASDRGRYVVMPPASARADAQARTYVLFLRTERCHFDLGVYGDLALFEGL